MSGTSAVQSSRCSTKSSSAPSAQWRSSMTRTVRTVSGHRLEEPRQAVNASSRLTPALVLAAPTSGASRDANHARSASSAMRSASVASSFARASRGSSDSRIARLGLHDLAERPERDALAVGQAAPVSPGDEIGPLVECRAELRDEAALPDPRLADDRDELHRRLALARGGTSPASSVRSCSRPTNGVWASQPRCLRRRGCGRRQPARPGSARPSPSPRPARAARSAIAVSAERMVASSTITPPTGAARLQAGCRVDDVARDDPLATLRTRAERDDCLARRHGRANGELETLASQLLDGLEDAKRGPDRTLGVVLVRERALRRRP